jgi:hypothetical protein
MEILASQISKMLQESNQCGVYEPDLSLAWPADGKPREPRIAAFAEVHGWRLRYYKEGFCAIFDKDPHR